MQHYQEGAHRERAMYVAPLDPVQHGAQQHDDQLREQQAPIHHILRAPLLPYADYHRMRELAVRPGDEQFLREQMARSHRMLFGGVPLPQAQRLQGGLGAQQQHDQHREQQALLIHRMVLGAQLPHAQFAAQDVRDQSNEQANRPMLDVHPGSQEQQTQLAANNEIPLKKLGWYNHYARTTPICTNIVVKEEEFYKENIIPETETNDWRTFMTSIKERTSYLCCNEVLSDVVITVKLPEVERHFPAHRFILALRSPFFRVKYYHSFLSENESDHCMQASESTARDLLRYIYSDDVPPTENVMELSEQLNIAYYYLILPLCAIYEKRAIRRLLNANSACHLFEISYLLPLEDLKKDCLRYYNTHFEEFLSSAYFLSLNSGIVKTLYSIAIANYRKKEFTPHLFAWGRSELRRQGMASHELGTLLEPFMKLHCVRTDCSVQAEPSNGNSS